MIIRREALQAALAATTADDTRYFLNAVQVRPDGSVAATNGYVAFIVSDSSNMADADFPIVPGAEFHGSPAGNVLVSADVCKRLIKGTEQGKRSMPILRCVQVSKNGSEETATLAATDLKIPTVATVTKDPDANFPVLERVIPKADKEGIVSIVLGTEVLEQLIKATNAIKGERFSKGIRFDIPTHERDRMDKIGTVCSAVRVTVKTAEGLELVGAIMPMRD